MRVLLRAAMMLSARAAAASLSADSSTSAVAQQVKKPNILHILLDDFGWADAGWHRPSGYSDVQSPNMDLLVREGVELERHYVFQFCSPTRSAMQSGRNPIHVRKLTEDTCAVRTVCCVLKCMWPAG